MVALHVHWLGCKRVLERAHWDCGHGGKQRLPEGEASGIVAGSLGLCGSPRDSRACSKSALSLCYCVFGGGPATGLEQPAHSAAGLSGFVG